MIKCSTLAGTTLAALLAVTVIPAPAADGSGRVSQEEFNRAHTEHFQQRTQSANQQRQRELYQQQYQQRQQQMYQERMNMGGPGGMSRGQGPGGGRR